MNTSDEIDKLKIKNLCHHCVEEDYLRAEIQCKGHDNHCSYCGKLAKSYTIAQMAERIETVFEKHYRRTSDQPDDYEYMMLKDKEEKYDWERHGEPVIQAIADAANMPEAAAADIQAILADEYSDFEADKMVDETEFSSESYYEEKSVNDQAWQQEWQDFERSLKTEARFFSSTAAAHLASVFKDIENMSTADGKPLVISAGPETSPNAIYRARVFQSDDLLVPALCRPDQQLGSPPANLAGAGRMNARGISVFYGANEPQVAIAEVRPPVGSQVAVARFEIIRKLRLLDLTALSTVAESGSIFDPDLANRMERAKFLQSLSQRRLPRHREQTTNRRHNLPINSSSRRRVEFRSIPPCSACRNNRIA
jgi:hypothetical protein